MSWYLKEQESQYDKNQSQESVTGWQESQDDRLLVGDEHVNGLSVMYEASAGIKEEKKRRKGRRDQSQMWVAEKISREK